MNEHDVLKKDHPFSYKGVFYSYDFEEIKESKPFRLSLIASFMLLVITAFSQRSYYDIVSFWSAQIVSIFPNLLGFNFGGYALIVGFGNTELVESMTKKKPMKKTTVFQKLSGIFAFAILIQLSAFVTAFVVNLLIQFKFECSVEFLVYSANALTVIALSFLGFWGLFIIPNLVVNVFDFGQMHHFHLTMKRMRSERDRRTSP